MNTPDVLEYLNGLLGLQLSIARRAGAMRNFHFGPIRQLERGNIGRYALHIQCPWRLEGPFDMVTGSSDLWKPADQSVEIDWDNWDYNTPENLQDVQLQHLLQGYDARTRSTINRTSLLVVELVTLGPYGGIVIRLSGNYRLVLFPTGTQGEHWRVFQPDSEAPHIVSENQGIALHMAEE